MELINEIMTTFGEMKTAAYHLRYILALPFIVLGTLMAWGWWTGRVV